MSGQRTGLPGAPGVVIARGGHDVRDAWSGWRVRGVRAVLGAWAGVSLAVAVALLVTTLIVALAATPDPGFDLAGVTRPASPSDVLVILTGNLLVLALHTLACLAAYLARRTLELEAARYGRLWRGLNTRVGSMAMIFVACATAFSFATQARFLGASAASTAAGLGTNPALLLVGLLPHALPELTAMFLPLAAWGLTGVRQRRWNDLLGATLLSTAVAAPVILASAIVEVYLSPLLIRALI